jgi:hypothetical protein
MELTSQHIAAPAPQLIGCSGGAGQHHSAGRQRQDLGKGQGERGTELGRGRACGELHAVEQMASLVRSEEAVCRSGKGSCVVSTWGESLTPECSAS